MFEVVNQETDKLELKRRQKQSEESEENCKYHSVMLAEKLMHSPGGATISLALCKSAEQEQEPKQQQQQQGSRTSPALYNPTTPFATDRRIACAHTFS